MVRHGPQRYKSGAGAGGEEGAGQPYDALDGDPAAGRIAGAENLTRRL